MKEEKEDEEEENKKKKRRRRRMRRRMKRSGVGDGEDEEGGEEQEEEKCKQCTWNATWRRVRVTTVTVWKVNSAFYVYCLATFSLSAVQKHRMYFLFSRAVPNVFVRS